MKIVNRTTREVIFEDDSDSLGRTVEAAIQKGVDLRYADFRNAQFAHMKFDSAALANADFQNANLSFCSFKDANLNSADFCGANMKFANFSGALLINAALQGTYLKGAIFTDANLDGTCIGNPIYEYARRFARDCKPVGRHGGRIVYRTTVSVFIGDNVYLPGKTYVAPNISYDASTACHPGIYAYGTLKELKNEYEGLKIARCYVRDGDYIVTAKEAIRCKRIRVLNWLE